MSHADAILDRVQAIGNIEFRSLGEKKCDIPDKAWLDVAAGLLQVPGADLSKSLLVRELRIKGQATTMVIQGNDRFLSKFHWAIH